MLLPSMDDVAKLRDFLTKEWKESSEALRNKYTYEAWLRHLQVTLISVLFFNRRRTGESERTKIADFKNARRLGDDTYKGGTSLSTDDLAHAEYYMRFEIVGKKDRLVPVLVLSEMKEGIQLLLKYRVNAKVHNRNPFLYGIPGYDEGHWKHLRACPLLRRYAAQCGAEHPERLRGTQLRKQLATQCADVNIDENQVVDLANFMGHAEKIHREHYRQPVARRDVCGISKLLETASGIKQASGSENTPEETTIDTERESKEKNKNREHTLHTSDDEEEAFSSSSEKSDLNARQKRGRPKKVNFATRKRIHAIESSDSEDSHRSHSPKRKKKCTFIQNMWPMHIVRIVI